jgi:hypothetical protein
VAAASNNVICTDCVSFGEKVTGVLMRCCPGLRKFSTAGNISVVGMQGAFAAASAAPATLKASLHALNELRHLVITIPPPELLGLVSLYKNCVVLLRLRLLTPRRTMNRVPMAASPLAALADMARLRELDLNIYDDDAQLTAEDVEGLCALPLGLRKLVLEGDRLTAPSMTDADLVAVAARLPDLVDLRVLFGAPRFTPDLLPKVGEACRGLERLHLPLRCDAGALERWRAERATAAVPVLFPRLTKVALDVLEDLRVWT